MKILRDIAEVELPATCVAVGVFDGVHAGHQAVLREAVAQAADLEVVATALTFDPHPEQVLRPAQAPKLLTTIAERAALIAQYGIEVLLIARFDRAFAGQTPEEFVRGALLERFGARCVVAGEGFRFGRAGAGNIHVLAELGRRLGFCATAVKRVTIDGETVSSTRVRELITSGDIERATTLLGHYYTIGGPVVRGDQRGRALGIPTANLCVEPAKLLPPDGVYAVRARVEGAQAGLPAVGAPTAVANIGVRPTFGGSRGDRCVEAHIIDSDAHGDPSAGSGQALYGREVTLDVVGRLREERRFPDAEALAAQIQRDIKQAREMLSGE